MKTFGKKTFLTALDTHLGYTYDSYIKDELINDEVFKNGLVYLNGDTAQKKIVVLGGSTSDIYIKNNWPRKLQSFLNKENIDYEVISGAFSGYSSSQEIIKLIRDVTPINPHFVISLSGVNEINFIQAYSPQTPYTSRYLNKIYNYIHLSSNKNFVSNKWHKPPKLNTYVGSFTDNTPITSVNHGYVYNLKDYQIWVRNMEMMNSICRTFSINFISILQPILGYGDYLINDKEQYCLNEFSNVQNVSTHGICYLKSIRKFYDSARNYILDNNDFMHDFSNILAGNKECFSDPRHLNSKGNSILSKAIIQTLKTYKLHNSNN